MKQYSVVFLLLFALWGCTKKEIWINDFSFHVDGIHYDLSRIDEKKMNTNEFGVNGYRSSETAPLDCLLYYFMGYNATSMIGDYGGHFWDRSVQKQTVFEIPDATGLGSHFWLVIDWKVYDAISGYIEMITDVNLDTEYFTPHQPCYYKSHGTFDFIMVNKYNESDTIHVTNGKFKYQCYPYCEYYDWW